jgi:hypothetical protein
VLSVVNGSLFLRGTRERFTTEDTESTEASPR